MIMKRCFLGREGGGRAKLRAEVMVAVRAMARAMGKEFLFFVPSVEEAMREGGTSDTTYVRLVRFMMIITYTAGQISR